MTTVTVEQGVLRGSKVETENGVSYYEFLGVPYAKPPIGDLRFKSPQPLESWDGERDVTYFNKNNISCQMDARNGEILGSEDCLYLNVHTPNLQNSDTDLLPVMLFIHGGGFVYSNGIDKEDLGPDYLIENGVVVVTINYRLGAFGFLQLNIPEAAGNMGLKDQVQALRWVQNNIDKFCGDPNNVTIFGISAGSASVEYQMVSPLAKGLFHKAILQSGSTLNHWTINLEPRKVLLKLLNGMGYTGSKDDNRAIHEYLINSPVSKILKASSNDINKSYDLNRMFLGFVPTIEEDFGLNDTFLAENPYKLIKEGRFNKVPVIKGFCNKEGYLTKVINANLVKNLIQKKKFVEHWAHDIETNDKLKWDSRLLTAYMKNIEPDDKSDKMGVDFFSDFDFVAGIWLSAEIMANQGIPVYIYELCYEGNMNFFKIFFGMNDEGAAHGDDIAYIFKHTLTKYAKDTDIAVRTNLTKLWTNFAKTGVPSSDTSIQWPIFTIETRKYISIKEDVTVKSNYEPEKMDIFREIYDKYEK